MAVTNKFSIQYGSTTVGGTSNTYLLHGPYIIDKSYENFRLVFDVVVVATSYSTVQSLSATLEDAFRERDQNIIITLDVGGTPVTWGYTRAGNASAGGTTAAILLKSEASLSKTGDTELDRGYSRAYTCVITAEMIADDDTSLRDVEILANLEPSRQKIVTMRGTYTATSSQSALDEYTDNFDAEATIFLNAIDSSATFELVDESYQLDRNKNASNASYTHLCNFTRQYTELLFNQSSGTLDDTDIRDHRVTFTDLSQHPGDSRPGVYRLRRVLGSYDCSIDIDQTTDLQTTFTDKVKPHVIDTFRNTFDPVVIGIEDQRIAYDETQKRLSASITFLYQSSEGTSVLELNQSLAYEESRTLDKTPLHRQSEYAYEVDPGWAVRQRVWTRTVLVIGDLSPKFRIISSRGSSGFPSGVRPDPDPFTTSQGGSEGFARGVRRSGWNVVRNTSSATPQFIGDPSLGEQIRTTLLSETVIEEWNEAPR